MSPLRRKSIDRPRRARVADEGPPGAEAGRAAVAVERPAAAPPDRPASRAPIATLGLTKEYGDLVAVDSLDLEVRAGEIFGLLGQNGAGKTTTILMLLGLTEPTYGEARVVGLDPARDPLGVKRRVGYLPDAVGFYGGMTGRENIRYTARLNGLRGPDAEARIDAVLDQVGLTDRSDTRVDTYSRGMKQRLGIADALVKDPDVLILDEPTTAIDPIGVVEILDLLRALVHERGMAILLSSHLLNQVQNVCDRIGIFAAGRLIGIGTVPELARRFGDGAARVVAGFEGLPDGEARERVSEALGAIDGVAAVHPPTAHHGDWTLEITSPGAVSGVLAGVLLAAARDGLRLTSIRELVPSLDDIYRRAVAEAGVAGDDPRRAVA